MPISEVKGKLFRCSLSRAQVKLIREACFTPKGVELQGHEWITAKALDGRGIGVMRMGTFRLNDRSRDLLILGYVIGKNTP